MSLKRWAARVVGMLRPDALRNHDLAQELRTHIEFETDENIARGMTPADARRAAALTIGNPTLAVEESGAMWTLPTIESIFADVRFGWRMLLKAPAVSIITVVTLALGIGAATAVFSVANGVVLRPLPYPRSHELVVVSQFSRASDTGNWRVTPLDYLDWRERTRSFVGVAAYSGRGLALSGKGLSELVLGITASANLFDVLGVHPALGRGFGPEDEQRGRDRVVVLSYGLWQRRFGGNRQIIGSTLTINAEPYEVIGVMPQGFVFPSREYDAWVPFAFYGSVDPQWVNRSAHFLVAVGRLKAGVSIGTAGGELRRFAEQMEQVHPDTNRDEGARVQSLHETIVGQTRSPLLLLLGAALCLLAIGCANVASLLVARATARQREMTVRQALGAGRARLVRQLLTEHVVLAATGGALGVGLAYALVAEFMQVGPADLPRLNEVHVDVASLLFASAMSGATGLFFGLGPLLSVRRVTIADALKESARMVPGGRRVQRARGALITTEIAASMVLLLVAGLTIRSFLHLTAVNPGFDPDHAVTVDLALMEAPYPTASSMRTFTRKLLDRLHASLADGLASANTGGVQAAALTTRLPLSEGGVENPVTAADIGESALADICVVTPEYFAAVGTPVPLGRSFSAADTETSGRVAIINEAAARLFFPNQSPIGRRIKLGRADSTDTWRIIVGVSADVKERALDAEVTSELYLPYAQLSDRQMLILGRGLSLVIRTNGELSRAAGVARHELASIDPDVPLRDAQPMRALVGASIAEPRFRTLLFAAFGTLALLLTGVGLYGVLSYSVAQRAHEFGVRMAIGANRADLLRVVLTEGGRLVAVGLLFGFPIAIGAARALRGLLFGVTSTDPLTFAAVVVTIVLIGAIALMAPALRAMHTDPLVAIRRE